MSAAGTPPRRPAKRDTSTLATSSKPKDPAIERALQLTTFESNYVVEDFIGTLSEKLINESKGDPGPFNPTPFLQTFSPALDSLLNLRKQVAERTKKMEMEVRKAEREYGRRLRELDGGFEAIGSSFSNLESKITDVGRTAVRIGEQLESLHLTRSTAQTSSLLLSHYLSLSHQTATTPDPNNPVAPTNPLETLFATRTSREGRARLAVILRRLMGVAKDVADNAATAVHEAETAATPKLEGDDGAGTPVLSQKAVGKRKKEKEKAERVRDEIERYCEKFEKEVLRLFDRSYRKGDPRMMAHCAKTLLDFNGGTSCVQIYVNQHDFFISKDRVLEEAQKGDEGEDSLFVFHYAHRSTLTSSRWKIIGDPDAAPPTSEPGMEALFKEIRLVVSQEAQIIKAVFPNPTVVMQVFLQRVFAQVIQQHLENILSRAASISTLAMLRLLHLTHSMSSALIEDLKQYDFSLSSSSSSTSGKASSAGANNTGPLAVMLDHSMEEMFVPWLEGSRYLDSESKNLVELYAGLLSRFTKYHETVLKAKPNSLLDRVVHQISSTTTHSSTAQVQSTAQSAAAAISKYANIFTSSTSSAKVNSPAPNTLASRFASNNGSETPRSNSESGTPLIAQGFVGSVKGDDLEDKVWATDGVLTVDMAERMLRWHAEAVGRVVELSASGDVAKNAFALSKVLAEAIGRSFIETALDSSAAKLESDPKSEPDLSPLQVLKPADLICHLWQRYTATALLPLAGGNVAIRREMSTFNSNNVVRMEGKVNVVIQKALDGIIVWLTFLLTKQKKNDFKPRNDDLSFARTTTEPCESCCEFLDTVKASSAEGLSGKNAELFLTEVGVAFHSLLLDHFKKFPVNPTGGLMLTKDLASYQETVHRYAIPALNDRFDMLRQLGNSFIVQPNVLKSYMTESHLGRIDSRYLRPYLAQRVDYSQFAKSLNLETLPAENQTPILNKNISRIAVGGSRLSGVAGVGMGKLKEMLKEFEALTPEEVEALRRKSQRSSETPKGRHIAIL
ncbi:exocyst complex component 5, partial [Tremellales sp. Uapishka_1]